MNISLPKRQVAFIQECIPGQPIEWKGDHFIILDKQDENGNRLIANFRNGQICYLRHNEIVIPLDLYVEGPRHLLAVSVLHTENDSH